MVNIEITPTAVALLQELMQVTEGEPAAIIEQALICFRDRRFAALELDTTVGFPMVTEVEILVENDRRWAVFQEQGDAKTHDEVVSRFDSLIGPIDV